MTQIAKNYADALYELAWDEGLSDELLPQLKGVRDIFHANPDYLRLLSAPNIPKPERLEKLDEAFAASVHPYLLSFLKLLCEQGNLDELRSCYVRYRARWAKDHGILEATAVSAVPLGVAQVERISKKLEEITGERVNLFNRVDPSVLGGIRLEFNGRQLDGTLRQRLAGIEKTLSETVL